MSLNCYTPPRVWLQRGALRPAVTGLSPNAQKESPNARTSGCNMLPRHRSRNVPSLHRLPLARRNRVRTGGALSCAPFSLETIRIASEIMATDTVTSIAFRSLQHVLTSLAIQANGA